MEEMMIGKVLNSNLDDAVRGIRGNYITVSYEGGHRTQGEFINAWDWDPKDLEENETVSGFVAEDGLVYREIEEGGVFLYKGDQTQTGYFPGHDDWADSYEAAR